MQEWVDRRQVLAGAGGFATTLAAAGGVSTRLSRDEGQETMGEGWPMARHDPGGTCHARGASGPEDAVQVDWQAQTDGRIGLFHRPVPIVSDDTIYLTGEQVLTVDGESRSVESTIDRTFPAPPALVRGRAYATPSLAYPVPGGAVGIDPSGSLSLGGVGLGATRWQSSVAGDSGVTIAGFVHKPTTPPVAVGRTVVVTAEGLVAIDAGRGDVRWHQSSDTPFGRPAVRNDIVYAPFEDGVVGFDVDTGVRTTEIPRDDGYWTALTAGPDCLLVADSDGLAALGYDGTRKWNVRLEDGVEGRYGALATADGRVFASVGIGAGTSLTAFDVATGSELWRAPVGPAVFEGEMLAPAVADDLIYVTTERDDLACVDASTGEVRWRFDPEDDRVLSPPAVAGQRVYVTGERTLYALVEP